MSLGTLFVGMALVVVVVAYVARPFRTATKDSHPEKAVEFWVARIREEQEIALETGESASPDVPVGRINYCPACGRQVDPGDRFCSGCGARLRGGKA